MTFLKQIFLVFLSLALFVLPADAQRRDRSGRKGELVVPIYKDTTKKVIPDSVLVKRDSLLKVDSLMRVDSIRLMKQTSLEFPAFSTAKDSLIESFVDGHKVLQYYGEVQVDYGGMSIKADYMRYDIDEQTVYARGTYDPITKETTGNPVMVDKSQGNKEYEMKEVTYNFATRKAFIKNMITNEAEGIMRGRNIKMEPDQSINIKEGRYTVCDCDEPHYYLHLTAAKVMTKPTQNTVFGPAWPVVEGVPLFPIVLPFGFVPKLPNSRASGILFPTFGEEAARGFFMRDLGIYIPLGDYFDVALTGSYYSLGSWNIQVNSRYKWRYHFNGSFGLTYSYNQIGIKGEPDFQSSTDFKFNWSHSQDSKSSPGMSFSASVSFSSPGSNKYNYTSLQEATNNQTQSSISWSKNWNGKVSLSVNATHSQNSRDSSYAFTMPNITLSVSKFNPFKRKNRVGKERFYEKFSLSYSTSFQNKVNFRSPEFAGQKPMDLLLNKMQNGMKHNFSIGLPSFTLFRFININPSISYGMNWYFNSTQKVYNEETGKVEDVKGKMFSTFGATHDYSGSISADTQIYGTFNFGKHRRVQAIRHIIKPSVSISYNPDKGKYFNGWRTLNYTDAQGNAKTLDYNIYAGQMNSPPGKGSSGNISLRIGNNLEAKVRDLRDTTGTGSKKVKLIDQLNISTGYNFLKDSLRMNDVGINITTNVFGKLNVSGSLNFSPYAVNPKTGSVYNKFSVMAKGHHLLRFTNASFTMSYAINGKGAINGNDGSKEGSSQSSGSMPHYNAVYYHPLTGEYIPGGWIYYTNPNSPWSVNMSMTFSCNMRYQYDKEKDTLVTKPNFTSTLSLSGNIKITNALSVNASTGFDFVAMKMSPTQLSASYDLHCFNMQISWVPFGQWKQWSFTIAANAAALADLLRIRKSSSMYDNY